jgi:hypothetical protein
MYLLASAVLLTGCAHTRSYQVAVRNETAEPITVGFAKEEGGPFEPAWATPEQVAIESPTYTERTWDSVVVPPGKTGVAGPLQGKFDSTARAFLRVYAATGALNDLLAISRGSPRRAEVPLCAGRNALIVRNEEGRLVVERVNLGAANP